MMCSAGARRASARSLMLKFFEIEARFPEFLEEFPQSAVE
jgi:hypothetical protein